MLVVKFGTEIENIVRVVEVDFDRWVGDGVGERCGADCELGIGLRVCRVVFPFNVFSSFAQLCC